MIKRFTTTFLACLLFFASTVLAGEPSIHTWSPGTSEPQNRREEPRSLRDWIKELQRSEDRLGEVPSGLERRAELQEAFVESLVQRESDLSRLKVDGVLRIGLRLIRKLSRSKFRADRQHFADGFGHPIALLHHLDEELAFGSYAQSTNFWWGRSLFASHDQAPLPYQLGRSLDYGRWGALRLDSSLRFKLDLNELRARSGTSLNDTGERITGAADIGIYQIRLRRSMLKRLRFGLRLGVNSAGLQSVGVKAQMLLQPRHWTRGVIPVQLRSRYSAAEGELRVSVRIELIRVL